MYLLLISQWFTDINAILSGSGIWLNMCSSEVFTRECAWKEQENKQGILGRGSHSHHIQRKHLWYNVDYSFCYDIVL